MMISPNSSVKLVVPVAAKELSPNSPLVNYALRGLERCWLPRERRWSHIYHLDGRAYILRAGEILWSTFAREPVVQL